MSKGFHDVRIAEGGYSALTEALKPSKILKVVQGAKRGNFEMTSLVIVGLLIFIVAIAMTMVGKGGGNFYVVILTIANIPMHEAATTGQFILFSASVAAMIIFQKNKSVSWALAVLIGTFTALSALGGGY